MKVRVGVDAGSGLTHNLVATTAINQDVTYGHRLIEEDNFLVDNDKFLRRWSNDLTFGMTQRSPQPFTISMAARARITAAG